MDDGGAKEVLRNHAGIITHKVNFQSLKAHLYQHQCVSLEDLETRFPEEAPNSQNNLKLIGIISRRGIVAFNGFLKALNENETFEPAHKELYGTLNEAASKQLSKRRRPSGSSYKSQTSRGSLRAGLLGESMETSTLEPPHESQEDILKREEEDETFKDMPQPPMKKPTIDTSREQPNTGADTAPQVSKSTCNLTVGNVLVYTIGCEY